MADDHDFGSLDASERPGLALDKLYSFLDSRGSGSHSYLLWFWQFADANQLLATTIQRLSDSVGAASANKVPSVIRPPRASTVPTVPVSIHSELLYSPGAKGSNITTDTGSIASAGMMEASSAIFWHNPQNATIACEHRISENVSATHV